MERNQGTSKGYGPIRFLAIVCILTAAVLVRLGWGSYRSYHADKLTKERSARVEQLRGRILHLDEVLTMSARMAAQTGDLRWEQRYRRYEPKLDEAIKEAAAVAPETYSDEAAAQTDAANIVLVEMENRAFDLVHQDRLEEAQAVLFSGEYEKQKGIYAQGMTRFALTRYLDLRLHELRGIIAHLDEVLTMSVRMAAATGDMRWEERYHEFKPQLDAAITEAVRLAPGSYSAEAVAQTDAANIALVDMENQAFDLVRTGRLEEAQAILFGDEYREQKEVYVEGMEQFDAYIKESAIATSGLKANRAFLHIASVIVALLTLFVGWGALLPIMRKWQVELSARNRELGEQATELTALNTTLDQRVAERTKELEDSQIAALNMMADAVQAKAAAEEAEETLRGSEQRYRSLVENIRHGIALVSSDYEILMANAALGELFSKSVCELVGKRCFAEFGKRHAVCPHCPGTRALASSMAAEAETEGVRDDGSRFSVRIQAFPVPGPDGTPTGFIEVFEDITERKRAEEERERLLHDMGERVKELKCMYRVARSIRDADHLVGMFQDVLQLIPTGWHYPEITRAKIWHDEQEYVLDSFKETEWKQSSDIVIRGECRGSVEIFYLEERPELDEGPFLKEERNLLDGLAHALGEGIDRKQTEERLRLQSAALTAAANAIVITDSAGNISFVNPAFTKLSGYAAEEVLGQTPSLLKSGKHDREFYDKLWNTVLGGRVWQGELIDRHKDGRLYVDERTITPVRDDRGEITHFVAIGQDITDRKRAEEELAGLNDELVQASRLAGMAETASSVLHNVGNVLNSVNVSATRVAEKVRRSRVSDLTEVTQLMAAHAQDLGAFIDQDQKGRHLPRFLAKLAEHLTAEQAIIGEELGSLTENIDHIKNIVSMQQSYTGVSGVVQSMCLSELLDDVLKINTTSLARHGIDVVRDYGEIPPMEADKHKLLQILVNLVRNARDALVEGNGEDKKLTIRATTTGENQVRIEVIDNGVGIPAENLTRIFGHGFTTKKDGHGFGIHSSSLTAKEMDGSLTAHSEGPGTGATFTLELPLKTAEVKR